MSAPLTTNVALAFGVVGIVAALIAHLLPRRPPVPRDWDPYRWRVYQQRLWPEESLPSQFRRGLHAVGHGRLAHTKAITHGPRRS